MKTTDSDDDRGDGGVQVVYDCADESCPLIKSPTHYHYGDASDPLSFGDIGSDVTSFYSHVITTKCHGRVKLVWSHYSAGGPPGGATTVKVGAVKVDSQEGCRSCAEAAEASSDDWTATAFDRLEESTVRAIEILAQLGAGAEILAGLGAGLESESTPLEDVGE